MTVYTEKSKICRAEIWRSREEFMLQFESKDSVQIFLIWGSRYFLLRLSTDWLRSAHITGSNLLYSESTGLYNNFIQENALKEISKIVWPNIWVPWPSQIDT